MFRVFGHDRVWVLDGGLPRWRASGYDVESSASSDAILKASAASEAIEKVYQGQAVSLETIRLYFNDLFPVLELNLTFAFYFKLMCCFLHVHFFVFQVGPITFETKFQPHLVWTLEQVGFIFCVISNVNYEYVCLVIGEKSNCIVLG
jgi:thiosulfate/3-mercaptopyruvate sulfurtransferase